MEDTTVETTPLSKKIVPARGAAQKAAATLKEQSRKRPRRSGTLKPQESDPADVSEESDLADDDDDDDMGIGTSPRRRGTGSRGMRARGRGRGRGAAVRGDAERTLTRRRSSKKSLKTAPSSSTSSSRSVSPAPAASIETPQKRSRPSASDTPSKRSKLTTRRKSQPSQSANFPGNLLKDSPSCRTPSKFANVYIEHEVIWVRINTQGAVADTKAQDDQLSFWWPAQVTDDDPLEISARLFGDDGHGSDRLVSIDSPSSSTVLPFRNEDSVRFSPSTFALADNTTDIPSKLVKSWTDALDQALLADVDDELPEAPSLINLMSATGKGKKKEQDLDPVNVPHTPTPSQFKRPPVAPLDEEIKVGRDDGELVLASDHKDRPDHWPARVVGVTQDKKSGKWLYEVCYIDGKEKKMERNRFFASDQDGFATCQLGKWETEIPASDSEAPDSEDELRACHEARLPSPSPSNADLDVIDDTDAFCAQPLAEQMRHVYPFLCRIIRREYEPSLERHDAFMKGGKARQQLGQIASVRGHFSENEIKKVSHLVRRTMLRDERWAERVQDGDEVRGEERDTAPPDGSDGTKAESVADSVPQARSSDLDAALALTELKSSDVVTHAVPSPSVSPVPGHLDGDGQNPILATIGSSNTLTTEMDTDAGLLPPSSAVLDHTSDMELDTDEEHLSNLPSPSQKISAISPAIQKLEPTQRHPTLPSGQPSNDVPATSLSRRRPTGCEDYEDLGRSERGMYCADVLLPEAVLQLHLFRDGRRKSSHLLTPEEENNLYQAGQELVTVDIHWITQIMQMRQLAENSYKKRTKKKDQAPVLTLGGTSTRPKARKVSE